MGLPLAAGDPAPLLAFLVTGAALAATVRAFVPEASISTLARVVALAFALRAAVAVVIHTVALWAGRGGFITGDDAGYAALAWGFAQYLHGRPEPPFVPPHWNGAAYQFGPFTYLEAAVFYVFGPRVILVEFLDAGLASASIVFVYRIARAILGRPAATATSWILAVHPSLILWSALNLREALAYLTASLTLWILVELRRTRRVSLALALIAMLMFAKEVRGFAFAGLALATVTAAAAIPSRARGSTVLRVGGAIGGAAAIALLVAAALPGRPLAPYLLSLEAIRQAMANEARTAFHPPRPVVASDGDTFVVNSRPTGGSLVVPFGESELPTYLGSAAPSRAVDPGRSEPRVVVARPPARIELADGEVGPSGL
ncbi:MAG: glycosyltransferase family 39 protein, partial [Elusimicrobia bacterium]|nr:glycosyltransferase family 39 protein [Elusimicrobiota bacterium]